MCRMRTSSDVLAEAVWVDTGSRLHFGFYSTTGDAGLFAGMGVAVDVPSFRAEVRAHEGVSVSGPGADRLTGLVEEVVRALGVPGAKVRASSVIPAHVGLGSTTQMKLGMAKALSDLYGLDMTVRELAFILGRGEFSGIGTIAFELGGFIIDTGRRTGRISGPDDLPRPLLRLDVPVSWRFLLLIREGARGLSEEEERDLLLELEPMPEHAASRICYLVMRRLLPAIIWDDVLSFGRALTEIQELVGEYFAPYQGGIFMDEAADELKALLLSEGAHGVGQSSWGPTLYAITTADECEALKKAVERFLEEAGLRYQILIARPRNRGARIERLSPHDDGGWEAAYPKT